MLPMVPRELAPRTCHPSQSPARQAAGCTRHGRWAAGVGQIPGQEAGIGGRVAKASGSRVTGGREAEEARGGWRPRRMHPGGSLGSFPSSFGRERVDKQGEDRNGLEPSALGSGGGAAVGVSLGVGARLGAREAWHLHSGGRSQEVPLQAVSSQFSLVRRVDGPPARRPLAHPPTPLCHPSPLHRPPPTASVRQARAPWRGHGLWPKAKRSPSSWDPS